MELPLKDKNEIKIFILYLMDRIGYPLKFTDVCSILYQENIVSYFECGDCFTELVDAHHIIELGEKDENGESLYQVSDTGKTISHELSDQINDKIKETSYRSAIRHLDFQKRGSEIRCNYEEQDNGKYKVNCEIAEKGRIVLSVSIDVDSKNEAETMMFNFKKKPEIVYRGTLALLSGEANYIFE